MRPALSRHLRQSVLYAPLTGRSKNGGFPEYGSDIRLRAHVEPDHRRVASAGGEEAVASARYIIDSPLVEITSQGQLTYAGVSRQILQVLPVPDTDGSLSHYEAWT